MSSIATFVENYPGFAAVILAVLWGCAYLFDLAFIQNKAIAGLTLAFGLLGLVGCFAGALKKGPLDVAVVVVSAIALVVVAHRFSRRGNSDASGEK
jgi:hypothetical protein